MSPYGERPDLPLEGETGIIGEYVGRIFEQVKHRPLYLVEEDTRLVQEERRGERVYVR